MERPLTDVVKTWGGTGYNEKKGYPNILMVKSHIAS